MLERFDRYQRTASANQILNARQFGGSAHKPATGVVWDAPTIGPDTLYDDTLEITVGGLNFNYSTLAVRLMTILGFIVRARRALSG